MSCSAVSPLIPVKQVWQTMTYVTLRAGGEMGVKPRPDPTTGLEEANWKENVHQEQVSVFLIVLWK